MSRPVRVGLIGVGRWGSAYLRTLQSLAPRIHLTHVAARHPERVGSLPARVALYRDWRRLVRADCDAVIIATPPAMHAAMLLACLEARKPCIVEKPLCLDLATAEQLHRKVLQSRVPVLVNHLHLFHLAYRTLKRTLAKRRERIRRILCEGMDLGPFRPDTTALWDWAPHDLSLCLDLMGAAPRRVEALGGPRSSSGAPELVSIRLDFAGGAAAWIQVGCLSPHKRRLLSVFTDTRLYVLDDAARSQLTVRRFDFTRRYANQAPQTRGASSLASASTRSPLASAVRYFLDGLHGGDRTYFGTTLALDVTRVLTRCESSIAKREARHG